MIQFEGCHPINPLTGKVVRNLLVWFEELPDGSLYPVPRVDGPHRNCSALPNRARPVHRDAQPPDIGADVTWALIELCPNCDADMSAAPSRADSHNYGVTELGDVMSHTSRVDCPSCGWSALRRHHVPFMVRVP